MKVTMKELFNAHYEACDVCLHVGTLETDGKKEVRFYIWLNDLMNEITMQQEFYTYQTMFEILRFAPFYDEELEQLLKRINKFEQYWKQTLSGEWLSDEEMFKYKEDLENGVYDENLYCNEEYDDEGVDLSKLFEENDMVCTFFNGTLIKANKDGDGFVVVVEQEGEEPMTLECTSFENMLYGLAPIVQANINSSFELSKIAMCLKESFDTDMEREEIMELLWK